jgi:hypothetical protein
MSKLINTNIALKCWLVFFVVLILSGYTVEIALVLGALGALGGGFIGSWWKAKGTEDVAQPDPERVIVLVKKVRQRIEGQLGLDDDRQAKRSRGLKMGFFRVRDPQREKRKDKRIQGMKDSDTL